MLNHFCFTRRRRREKRYINSAGMWLSDFLTSSSIGTSLSPTHQSRESHRVNIRRRGTLSLTGCGLSLLLSGLKRCWGVSQEALIVLEAWKIVDENFVDDSFGGNNWSKVKYEILSKNDLGNRDGAYSAIQEMLGKLRDPYTRLLRPDEYKARKIYILICKGHTLQTNF